MRARTRRSSSAIGPILPAPSSRGHGGEVLVNRDETPTEVPIPANGGTDR
jgi:hypothetical protein